MFLLNNVPLRTKVLRKDWPWTRMGRVLTALRKLFQIWNWGTTQKGIF